MTPEEIAETALDAGEVVASILAKVPDPTVAASATVAVGIFKAIRAMTRALGAEKALEVIRKIADGSHEITDEDLAGDDAALAAKVRAMVAARKPAGT